MEVADPGALARAERAEAEAARLAAERAALQGCAWCRAGCGIEGVLLETVSRVPRSSSTHHIAPPCRDNSKLAEALAVATAGAAAAVEAARREERAAAGARMQAAVEEERKRHRCGCRRWLLGQA